MTSQLPAATAPTEGRAWIDALPPALTGQARLLHALLTGVETDVRWEALELGCSLAAGRGDELSDLDVGLWHVPGTRPTDEDVDRLVQSLGDVIEVSAQPWDDAPRWWGQYADGTQLDLVIGAADDRGSRAPGGVMLMNRGGRFATEFTPSVLRAKPDEPRQWLLDGWEALGNTAKYLHRGSLLEAVEQIQRARQRLFQLWATGEGVDYPLFGLTSLLDDDAAALPPDVEDTYPTINHDSVAKAANTLAALLRSAGHHADQTMTTPLADYVVHRLQDVADLMPETTDNRPTGKEAAQ